MLWHLRYMHALSCKLGIFVTNGILYDHEYVAPALADYLTSLIWVLGFRCLQIQSQSVQNRRFSWGSIPPDTPSGACFACSPRPPPNCSLVPPPLSLAIHWYVQDISTMHCLCILIVTRYSLYCMFGHSLVPRPSTLQEVVLGTRLVRTMSRCSSSVFSCSHLM